MRTFNKRLNGVASKSVSGYVSGVTMYLHGDSANATSFDIDLSITAATWESIGPTGSGADNIWTALDDVPAGAKFVKIKGYIQSSDASVNAVAYLAARVGGSATAYGSQTRIASTLTKVPSSTANPTTTGIDFNVEIPVSNNIFDMYYTTSPGTFAGYMYLIGWVI